MLKLKFILSKGMLGIFVYIDNKRTSDCRQLIVTYDVNFVTQIFFVFRCQLSTSQIRNLEPKGFVIFNQTINQRLDINFFSFFLTSRNRNLNGAFSTNRECMGGILSTDISMSSIFSMNAIFRVESKAITKRHIFFRSVT